MTEHFGDVSASSSSSLNSSSHDAADDQTIATILAEDENQKNGGKLGKRLCHLDSIPHTPRVNGEIPDVTDATLDHERLSERLATYGLAELQMEGDGNCQFRALADQLFHNPDYHKHVRKKVVKQLKHFKKLYEAYVPMKYKSYLKKMKKSGEWGDHVTLQAAADRYKPTARFIEDGLNAREATRGYFHSNNQKDLIKNGNALSEFEAKISLVTSFRDTCYIEIVPKDKNPSRELWLSFWSEVHYNSLYESGEVPTRAPKRKHWLF